MSASLRAAAQAALEALDGILCTLNAGELLAVSLAERCNALRAALDEPVQEPLTDEQIDKIRGSNECWDGFGLGARFKHTVFARAIERAHGIGGGK